MKLFFVLVTLTFANGHEEDRLVMASMNVPTADQCSDKALASALQATAEVNEQYPLNPATFVTVACFDAALVPHMEID